MDNQHFLDWLRAARRDRDGGSSARKRPRPSDSADIIDPPTPATMETIPDKRRRIGPSASHGGAGEDRTPRPRRPFSRAALSPKRSASFVDESSIRSHARSHASSSIMSEPSSNASARKIRRHVQLGPDPVKFMPFAEAGDNIPRALKELLLDFNKVEAGAVPIISHSRRDEIRRSEARVGVFENAFLSEGAGQGEVESPPLEDVLRIMRMANECAALRCDEHAWNCGVHFPLLRLAIPENSLLKIVPCTSARVSNKQFLPASVPNDKMVDFCLAIDPYWPLETEDSTPASVAVDEVRLSLSSYSISHTDYAPLAQYPIALSIAAKHQNGSGAEAEAQLGVWQTAQWKMLEAMVYSGLAPQGSDAGDIVGLAANPSPGACLEELGFLPGIYIVGHRWTFAATTRDPESGRTTLWTGKDFGSTSDALGIYRIIWCLRRIQKFLTEVYWPWYQKYVLDMEMSDG
ncbi:hypothetical protein GGTG_05044 [Gaeumannomyces tritici R3-111a-1]|uniref:PD-(D/E)XK nuclease-like domain-containing protein n=1 Tax=Gaeumannomyces tritici (strain R3-111a-1) TaxID=644352 RepID=J3NUT8_GAET3|nr:hypothetical protein GGTG_05044 [Gaeumannomyces tritici R3-111a-1]EJT79962.1 hypothetical protein GGTG_05044 [Gaeumannomyces tritici R3-111a-1]